VTDSKVMMIHFLQGAPPKLVLVANYNSSLMHDVAQELVQKSYDLVVFWRKSSKTKLYHSTLVTSEGRGIDVSVLSQVIAAQVGGTGGGHAFCSGMQTVI
jgi:alanyl-tRNA synthetase